MTAADADDRELRSATGKAIRVRRVELDLSRSDLAREAGLSYAYVSEIENGTKQASSKALWRIARAVGLEPHELMAAAAQWETHPGEATRAAPAAAPQPAGSRWFHGGRAAPIGDPAEGPPAAISGRARGGRAGATAGDLSPVLAALARRDLSVTAEPPELLEVLDRVAAALEGVPDERAELALMLSLDERRTRRIVREELDRRNDAGPAS